MTSPVFPPSQFIHAGPSPKMRGVTTQLIQKFDLALFPTASHNYDSLELHSDSLLLGRYPPAILCDTAPCQADFAKRGGPGLALVDRSNAVAYPTFYLTPVHKPLSKRDEPSPAMYVRLRLTVWGAAIVAGLAPQPAVYGSAFVPLLFLRCCRTSGSRWRRSGGDTLPVAYCAPFGHAWESPHCLAYPPTLAYLQLPRYS
jgi:hypothetical protein